MSRPSGEESGRVPAPSPRTALGVRRTRVLLAVVCGAALVVGLHVGDARGPAPVGHSAQGHSGPTAESEPATEGATATGEAVSALDLGAAGDGRTDDTTALQDALDGLHAGDALVLPAGHVFLHDQVLDIRTAAVTITGGGTLRAIDEERAAVRVAADDVTLRDLVLDTAHTSRRWAAPQQTGLWLDGHRRAVVEDVTVQNAASAGVFVQGAQDFRLTRVTVTGSRADGIHMTGGARRGLVEQAVTEDTGDDGIAIVAYSDDPAQAGDIRVESPRVNGTTWGRGLAVVGGDHVVFTNVDVRDTAAAAVYVACERGEFRTRVPSGVTVDGGRVSGANYDTSVDQGAVLIYNGQSDQPIRGVTVSDLTINDTRASVSRQVGLIADDDGGLLDILLEDIAITGRGPRSLIGVNTQRVDYRSIGWTVGGTAIPDRRVDRAHG